MYYRYLMRDDQSTDRPICVLNFENGIKLRWTTVSLNKISLYIIKVVLEI